MSTARQNLYNSIAAFSHALESPDITSKDPITEIKHNERARLLRNGLAVSSFAMVEEFVKERTGEVLEKIGDGITPFNDLPDGLKTAAIIGVAEAMQFQAKFIDRTLILSHYQNNAQLIASTLSNPYKISKIAFGNNYINLSTKEVESILEAFRVETPWNVLSGIVMRLGLGVLSPKQAFENATKRRHSAAHQISTNTEYSDLKSYEKEAISFCLAYDLLISKALKLIRIRDTDYLGRRKIGGSQIELRYIKPAGGNRWREQKETSNRAVRTSTDFEDIKSDCLLRARREGFAVVHTTELGIPLAWFTPDVDF